MHIEFIVVIVHSLRILINYEHLFLHTHKQEGKHTNCTNILYTPLDTDRV